jgi:hypothetical protein
VDQMMKLAAEELAKLSTPVPAASPLDRSLVLGVWLIRQKEGPLLDSRGKPVNLQGDFKWVADDAFAQPTETVEFRKATAMWPVEPAFQLRAGTITAWVKVPAQATCGIATKGIPGNSGHDDYSMFLWDGKLGTFMGWPIGSSAATLTPSTVPVGRWTFLAYTWDATKAGFWIDGKPAGIVKQAGPLKLTAGGFEIGDNSPGGSEFFQGRMAAVHLYSTNLTDGQVQDLMTYQMQYMKLRPTPAPAAAPASPAPAAAPGK